MISPPLAAFLTSGESDTLEFKKSTAEKDRACRTQEELSRELQNFEPPLFPAVERVPVDALANTFVHRDYGIDSLRFSLTPKYRATASGLTRIGRVPP